MKFIFHPRCPNKEFNLCNQYIYAIFIGCQLGVNKTFHISIFNSVQLSKQYGSESADDS